MATTIIRPARPGDLCTGFEIMGASWLPRVLFGQCTDCARRRAGFPQRDLMRLGDDRRCVNYVAPAATTKEPA